MRVKRKDKIKTAKSKLVNMYYNSPGEPVRVLATIRRTTMDEPIGAIKPGISFKGKKLA
jgi:acyl-CoA synthetase (NDP forming)